MSSHHKDVFEAVIPWQCIPDALAVFKTGNYSKENTGELMQHVAWFIGCTGRLIGGEPDHAPEPIPNDWLFRSEMPVGVMATDDLETKLSACYDQTQQGFGADAAAIPWQAIWQIAGPMLLELLKRWLENKAAAAK